MNLSQFFSVPRTNVLSSPLQFPSIDIDGMAKRLRLTQKAKEQGAKNLPTADSQSFDAVEQSIVSEIETEGNVQFSSYLDHQKTYASRAADAGLQGLQVQISAAVKDALSSFQRRTHVGKGELYALKRELRETEKELERFRSEHQLHRPAVDQGAMTFKVGVLVLILALEALLNGYFLAKGNVFGFLGGVSDALLIAAINILAGVVVGRAVLPYLGYRKVAFRVAAVGGLLAYLLFVLAFNLAVAHYRNAVGGADPFEAPTVAYQMLVTSPLEVRDLQSWALFFLGACFSFIAAYDGLRMDDPYPGYGRRIRHNLAALDEYTAAKTDLLQELDEIKKGAEAIVDDRVRSLDSRRSETVHVGALSQALKDAKDQHFTHLETSGNTLLRIYRDENRTHRKEPAPKRFESVWKYAKPAATGEVVRVDHVAIDTSVKTTLTKIESHRESLHAAYGKAMAEYKSIDELLEDSPS